MTIKAAVASKGCDFKGAKCDGSTAWCRNCRNVLLGVSVRVIVIIPITTVERVQPHESDVNASDDKEQAPETLPLVSRIADTIALLQTVMIVTMLLIHSYVYSTSEMIIIDVMLSKYGSLEYSRLQFCVISFDYDHLIRGEPERAPNTGETYCNFAVPMYLCTHARREENLQPKPVCSVATVL